MFGPRLRLELRLHRVVIVFALAMAVFVLALLPLLPWRDVQLAGSRLTIGSLIGGLYYMALTMAYATFIPMMIGASMIAAERASGVWDWRLSLPESRTRQWARKVGVGVGLTALLSGVLPALLGLVYGIAAKGEIIASGVVAAGGTFINGIPVVFVVGLPCLAFGMWASSLAADSLKALCLAVALMGLLVFSAALGDPMSLGFELDGRPLLALVYALLVAEAFALFRWNYGFARPSRRGAAAQVLAAALPLAPLVFTILCAWGWATSPWVGRAKATQVERWSPGWAIQFPEGTLQPLLVQAVGKRNSAQIETIYRRPGADELVVATGRNIVKLDANRGYAGGGYRLAGKFMAFASGRDFIISSGNGEGYFRVFEGILPVRMTGRYDPGIFGTSWNRDPGGAQGALAPNQQRWRWQGYIETPEAAGNFAVFRNSNPGSKGLWKLVGQPPGGKWREILGGGDEGLGTLRAGHLTDTAAPAVVVDYGLPTVTSDGRWATGFCDVWTTGGLRVGDAVLRAFDGSREITIPGKGRHLKLARDRSASGDNSENARSLGMKERVAPVSADGRYLSFCRSESFLIDRAEGTWDTGFPLKRDLMLLDTVTGGELVVYRDRPPFGGEASDFKAAFARHQIEDAWRAKTNPSLWAKSNPPPRRPPAFPPLAWAPDRNRFAALAPMEYGSSIEVYDVVESGDGTDAVKVEPRAILSNAPADQIAFLNGDTLLAWSETGLYRIDIKMLPRPPAAETAGK